MASRPHRDPRNSRDMLRCGLPVQTLQRAVPGLGGLHATAVRYPMDLRFGHWRISDKADRVYY